jgi:hypothetical protein
MELNSSPAIVKAYHMLKYSLIVAIASRQGTSALPDNKNILPNQNTWVVTMEQMDV